MRKFLRIAVVAIAIALGFPGGEFYYGQTAVLGDRPIWDTDEYRAGRQMFFHTWGPVWYA
ncbi:MAG: hypothetical protein G01um101420_374 [Parcubacteria group bacterium Gr01-1014_20]|nr:MAG: hypothetical protein G01um101420_374 [Parcubacteria group bacterium Gr01-1014_20]